MKKLITLKYIKSFNPCKDRLDNYIEHYGNKKFTLIEFLELDKITWKDKKWLLFHENQKVLSDELLREFAFICASRVIDKCDNTDVNYFFDLILNIYFSNSLELLSDSEYRAADRAADRAAYRAAYWAAYGAADRAAYWAAYGAADRAAYGVAYWAAYGAADGAAEENIQQDILVNLIIEELGG